MTYDEGCALLVSTGQCCLSTFWKIVLTNKILIHMEQTKTLRALFEQNKETLASQLESLSLPRDAQRVQDIVAQHLNNLLDSAGEYRQALTQSEEFILISALNLLQAQQAMIGTVCAQSAAQQKIPREDPANTQKGSISKEQSPFIIGGTVIGGAVGALMLNTWGALIGAIAGTALVLYYASNQEPKKHTQANVAIKTSTQATNPPIKVAEFLTIVGNICENVDGIIDTYRVQVKRIQNAYEQREKPTLQSDYGMLLDQIANVCRICESNKNSIPANIQNAVGMLAESLENYGLNYVNGKIVAE